MTSSKDIRYGCLFCNSTASTRGQLNQRHLDNFDPNHFLLGKTTGALKHDDWHDTQLISIARWKHVNRWAKQEDLPKLKYTVNKIEINFARIVYIPLIGPEAELAHVTRNYMKVTADWWREQIDRARLRTIDSDIELALNEAIEMTRNEAVLTPISLFLLFRITG